MIILLLDVDIGRELTIVLYSVFIVKLRELYIISRGNGRRIALENGCVDLFCCSVYQKDRGHKDYKSCISKKSKIQM